MGYFKYCGILPGFQFISPPLPKKKLEWFKQRMSLYHWKLHIQTKPQSHAVLHMINVILSTKKKTEVRTFKWKLTKISPFLVCKSLGKSIQLLSWWGFSVCCSHNNRLVIIFADHSWYRINSTCDFWVFLNFHSPETSASISRLTFVQTCYKSFVCAFNGVGFHVCFWQRN